MYKVILFDFFGVIRTDAYRAWLSRHDYPYEGAFREASRQMDVGLIDGKEFLQQLSDITGQAPEDIYRDMEDGVSVDIAVISLIKELKQSHQIGLLSNASGAFLREELNKIGITDLFDQIFASSELGFAKPSPEIFHHALSHFTTIPDATIFIDDSLANVAAADELGITSLLFTDSKTLHKQLSGLGVI